MKLLAELEKKLDLKFINKFNTRKAVSIAIAVVCLNLGILLVTTSASDQFYHIIGIACITLFVRIVMGPIVQQILTEDSEERLNNWFEGGKDDSDNSPT